MPEPICKATRDELDALRETDARIVQILHDLTARIAALERTRDMGERG
jgi:predicted AAA+ superfamily ATPase